MSVECTRVRRAPGGPRASRGPLAASGLPVFRTCPRSARVLVAMFSAALAACDDAPTAPRKDASIDQELPPPPAPPPREGCSRTGILDGIETDPTCVLTKVPDDAMRTALKRLTVSVTPELTEVPAGATSLLTIAIVNTSKAEALLVFEGRARAPGPRTDWARIAGVPEPKGASDQPRLFFTETTTDASERDVDALPTLGGSTPQPPPIVPLGVWLRPGGRLVHKASWWAVRIPAPAPIVQDDAGHRFVPKTTALPLTPGEYAVGIDVPFLGLSREERKVVARLRVVRPALDGG